MSKCGYCGRDFKALTKDHIQPKSFGGGDESANILPACKICNELKSNLSLENFKLLILERTSPRARNWFNKNFKRFYFETQAGKDEAIKWKAEKAAQQKKLAKQKQKRKAKKARFKKAPKRKPAKIAAPLKPSEMYSEAYRLAMMEMKDTAAVRQQFKSIGESQ